MSDVTNIRQIFFPSDTNSQLYTLRFGSQTAAFFSELFHLKKGAVLLPKLCVLFWLLV
jgi:hypothetical protein